jgi:hypothetical protein
VILSAPVAPTSLVAPPTSVTSPLTESRGSLSSGQGVNVSVLDSNWYFTEYNWIRTSSDARTANPGAYFKIGFTGNSFSLMVNCSGVMDDGVQVA